MTAPVTDPSGRPPRLDEEEEQAWLALGGLLAALPPAVDAQLERSAGMSHIEYQVLAALAEAPRRTLRISDLRPRTHGNLSHLSRVVARLEARGWASRRQDPDDGRSTLATLTDAGRDKLLLSTPGHVDLVRRLVFDSMTRTQVRQLTRIAARISRSAETY